MSTCLCTRSAHIYWESAECQLENAWFNFVLYAVHLQFSSGDANLVLEMFSKLKFPIEMEKGIRWRFPQSYSGTINCMNFACICLFYLSLHFFPLWLLLKTELEVLFSTDNDFMCVLFCHIVTQQPTYTRCQFSVSLSLSLSLSYLSAYANAITASLTNWSWSSNAVVFFVNFSLVVHIFLYFLL